MVDRTFTTHYDLTEVDLPCLVYDGGGHTLANEAEQRYFQRPLYDSRFLNFRGSQELCKRSSGPLRPFTTFYDLLRLHGCYFVMPSLRRWQPPP